MGRREREKDIANEDLKREEVGGVGEREVHLPKLWKQHLGERGEKSRLYDLTIGVL